MPAPPEKGNCPPAPAAAGSAPRGPVPTLKKRHEFLATRKGARWATARFVLEAAQRPPTSPAAPEARFGFTVSKKVGGAVERNRIKRRLKAAAACVSPAARPDFDYVLIARRPALDAQFAVLVEDLHIALVRVHAQRPGSGRKRPPPRGKSS